MTDAPATFNADSALVRLGGNRKLLCDLIGFFEEDFPKLLARLRKSLEDQNCDQVARAAHSLKGLVANFDAEATVASAQRIETAGMAGDLAAVPEELVTLEAAIATLAQQLSSYRASASA